MVDPQGLQRLVVVTGLSGSGKTVALRTLEDQDFYCIDNLPIALLTDLAGHLGAGEQRHLIALGIDARGRREDIRRLPETIDALRRDGFEVQVVYLEADHETLLNRFSETRRRHPLTNASTPLSAALSAERELLRPVAERADVRIDTSDMHVHQLRRAVWRHVGSQTSGLSLLLESFAFRHGLPADADFVFDARCLPNPHWEPSLRSLTGRDTAVQRFLDSDEEVTAMRQQIGDFLAFWLPRFEAEQRSYLTVAIGCTGGKHRSVYLVEALSGRLRELCHHLLVMHRELK